MSRSYKFSIFKQNNDKYHKKLFNKRVRKFSIESYKGFSLLKKLLNPWDICDWRWYPRNEEDKLKAKRK